MLRVHSRAVDLVRECVLIAREIERRDADLARQLKRAVISIPLNIAEGSDQQGQRRTNHYRYALGSAREAQSAVTVALAAGYVETVKPETLEDFGAVIGPLNKCVYR